VAEVQHQKARDRRRWLFVRPPGVGMELESEIVRTRAGQTEPGDADTGFGFVAGHGILDVILQNASEQLALALTVMISAVVGGVQSSQLRRNARWR
jgi:hypothetical protein